MDNIKEYLQNNINRLNNKLTSYLDIESSDLVREELESYEEQLKELNDLIEENNTLTKGIDELIEKYEDEKELIWHDIMCNKKDTPTYNRLSGELTQVNQILEDLRKLKGE